MLLSAQSVMNCSCENLKGSVESNVDNEGLACDIRKDV